MNDIKISCSGCGQHIACDDTWAGRQIACPTCQQPMVIPGNPAAPASPTPLNLPALGSAPAAPPAPSLATRTPPPPPPPGPAAAPAASRPRMEMRAASPTTHTSAPRPVPGPGPVPTAAGAATGKTSGLAIASLSCSIGTCLLGPFGCIPGIILGHMAKSRMRQDPSLRGSGLATAGLIIGYIFGVLWTIWFAIFGLALIAGFQKTKPSSPASSPFEESTGAKPRSSITRPSAGSPNREVRIESPADPVAGKIGPRDFTYDTATLEGGWLTLRQGADFFADAEIKVTLFEADQKKLGGKTITVTPGARGMFPHVRANWQQNGQAQNVTLTSGYTMTLHFDAFEGDKVRGNIDLKLPGKPGATVKGNFIARVK